MLGCLELNCVPVELDCFFICPSPTVGRHSTVCTVLYLIRYPVGVILSADLGNLDDTPARREEAGSLDTVCRRQYVTHHMHVASVWRSTLVSAVGASLMVARPRSRPSQQRSSAAVGGDCDPVIFLLQQCWEDADIDRPVRHSRSAMPQQPPSSSHARWLPWSPCSDAFAYASE